MPCYCINKKKNLSFTGKESFFCLWPQVDKLLILFNYYHTILNNASYTKLHGAYIYEHVIIFLYFFQKKERIVPISRLEAAPLQPAAIAPPVLAAGQPRGPAQARAQQPQQQAQPVTSKPSFQLQPPPQTFPRNRAQPSTTFRPPSLHLPGKEEIPK